MTTHQPPSTREPTPDQDAMTARYVQFGRYRLQSLYNGALFVWSTVSHRTIVCPSEILRLLKQCSESYATVHGDGTGAGDRR